MSAPYTTRTSKLWRPNTYRLFRHGSAEGGYWIAGVVLTPQGFVSIHSENTYTSIELLKGDQVLSWTWERGFSQRYLVTLAQRCALGWLP